MRMINAYQVHLMAAGFVVCVQQVLGTKLVARALRAFGNVVQTQSDLDLLPLFIERAEHRATALVGIGGACVLHHLGPRLVVNVNHSSSQKCSLRYLSAPSQKTVTMSPCSRASCIW